MDGGEEWIEPHYNLIDIMELELELEKRRCIEDFCIRFFKDWENSTTTDNARNITTSDVLLQQTCQLLIEEKRLYTTTKDLAIHLTMANFTTSFKAMCRELFRYGTKDEYVVSLLAFCITLDTCMREHIWYTPKLLITSLIDALEDAYFNPLDFHWQRDQYQSAEDNNLSILTPFIIIIPSLLLFYNLLR